MFFFFRWGARGACGYPGRWRPRAAGGAEDTQAGLCVDSNIELDLNTPKNHAISAKEDARNPRSAQRCSISPSHIESATSELSAAGCETAPVTTDVIKW